MPARILAFVLYAATLALALAWAAPRGPRAVLLALAVWALLGLPVLWTAALLFGRKDQS